MNQLRLMVKKREMAVVVGCDDDIGLELSSCKDHMPIRCTKESGCQGSPDPSYSLEIVLCRKFSEPTFSIFIE